MSTSPASVETTNLELSAYPLSAHESNCGLSTQSALVNIPNIELSVCPATHKGTNPELAVLFITAPKLSFEPVNLPVINPETINALHVYPVNPVTAIETIHDLSACSVLPNVYDNVPVCPVSTHDSMCELSTQPVFANDPNVVSSASEVLVNLFNVILAANSV